MCMCVKVLGNRCAFPHLPIFVYIAHGCEEGYNVCVRVCVIVYTVEEAFMVLTTMPAPVAQPLFYLPLTLQTPETHRRRMCVRVCEFMTLSLQNITAVLHNGTTMEPPAFAEPYGRKRVEMKG